MCPATYPLFPEDLSTPFHRGSGIIQMMMLGKNKAYNCYIQMTTAKLSTERYLKERPSKYLNLSNSLELSKEV